MNVQWLRSAVGEIHGLAIFFGRRGVVVAAGSQEGNQKLRRWRICDTCKQANAMVYCPTHSVYLCEGCLPLHNVTRTTRCGAMLSVAAARELANSAGVTWP